MIEESENGAEALSEDEPVQTEEVTEVSEATEAEKPSKQKKSKLSGEYWYIALEDEDLTRLSFTRSLLTIIAFMLQLVVLLLPQEGIAYITTNIPSYAYAYMWVVFIMIAVAIYAIVMCFTRNKLTKRIPVEHAPKNGFKFFTFISAEIFAVVLIVLFAMELSFVIMAFDAVGLVGAILCLASVGVQIWSRMIAHGVLKTAERVPAKKD